jgi:ABC-type Na+ efflux pump permease subunit
MDNLWILLKKKIIKNDENSCYLLIFLFPMCIPLQFLTESILSDKRNQTFERYFASGNIKTIMFAKYSVLSVLGIIPFIAFYTYFLLNGINIIDSIYVLINTPLYYWISLCLMTIICLFFNDEKAVVYSSIPVLLLMVGVIYLNNFIVKNYNPVFTCIISIACAVVSTVTAYKVYKNTKYFLKV